MKALERGSNQRRLGGSFIQERETNDSQRADQGDYTDQRMKKEAHPEEDRRPRYVHQRGNHTAGKDIAQRVYISHQLYMMRAARAERSRERRFERLSRDQLIEPEAGLHENAAAKVLEHGVADEQRQGDQGKQ